MTRDQNRSGVLSGKLANHVAIVSLRSPNDLVDQAEYRVALNRHPFHGPLAWQLVVGMRFEILFAGCWFIQIRLPTTANLKASLTGSAAMGVLQSFSLIRRNT